MKTAQLENVNSLNLEVFKSDICKVSEFLKEFNTTNKIRQVDIIKDSMISREKMIRNSATLGEYQNILNSMRKQPINNQGFTVYDQLKTIKRKFNLPSNNN